MKKNIILIICNLLAAVLFFSWLSTQEKVTEKDGDVRVMYKGEASFWKSFDIAAFNFYNGWVRKDEFQQKFWANTNRRGFDLVSAFLMISIYLVYILKGNISERIERVKGGFYMSLVMLLAMLSVQIFHMIFEFNRLSPTQIPVEGAVRLSKLSHISFDLKDSSKQSFPGDHSTVLFIVASFIVFYARKWYGVLAVLVAISFALPRVVGGGHWLTDILVGGGSIALVTVSWALCTPLHEKGLKLMQKPAEKLAVVFNKIFKIS